ncbi:MAG: MliC family protein [Paracoccaceae bacterium]
MPRPLVPALLLASLSGAEATAEADGPDHFRLRPIEGAFLPLREAPEADAAPSGGVPAGADGLANLGCVGGPSFADWRVMDEAERAAATATRWCRVARFGVEGWARADRLAEGSPPVAMEVSFDCAAARSTAEQLVCSDADLAALDRELARLYALAIDDTEGEGRRALRAVQRGWVKGRDDCWKGADPAECVADAYALRLHEIRRGFAASRAAAGPSEGPYPYACEGLDAVVSAVFVRAGTPRVSLLWRGNAMSMPLVPAGSGAKYAEDGAAFFTKGDEAILSLDGGADRACRRDGMD